MLSDCDYEVSFVPCTINFIFSVVYCSLIMCSTFVRRYVLKALKQHFYVRLNSVRLSVCLSVTRVDQSKTVQARITKSSPSTACIKTLFSGSIKLFHTFTVTFAQL